MILLYVVVDRVGYILIYIYVLYYMHMIDEYRDTNVITDKNNLCVFKKKKIHKQDMNNLSSV